MVIDLLMPLYRSAHPFTVPSCKRMVEFSSCKCHFLGIERLTQGHKILPSDSFKYFHGASECPHGKHDILAPPSISASVVHWSRNALLAQRRPNCDYVLFVDDDIVPEADSLDRLLAHKVDIVSGLLTRRCDPAEPTIRKWLDENQNFGIVVEWDPAKVLLEVDSVGTGFVLLSRKVIEQVAEAYHPEHFAGPDKNGFWFEFIKTPRDGEWGEDISFFWKAQRLGFKVYCDTTVKPAHVGDYTYKIDDYLEYQDAVKAGEMNLSRLEV